MSINIPCPRCCRRLALPRSVIGRLVQCPACQQTFTADSPVEEVSEISGLESALDRREPVTTLTTIDESNPADDPERPRRHDTWQHFPESGESRSIEAQPRPRPRKYFSFKAVVRFDSAAKLFGLHTAELTDRGLRLLGGSEGLFIRPGCLAEYLGGNQLNVTADGRRIKLEVSCGLGPRNKLARDLAAFLRGDMDELEPDRYRVPAAFVVLGLLPLAMTAALFGKVIWMAAGVGLALICLLIAFTSRWSIRRRFGLILSGSAVSCMTALASIFVFPVSEPVHLNDWKPFQPPNDRCKLLMPGTPVQTIESLPNGEQLVLHAVEGSTGDQLFRFSSESVRLQPDFPGDQHFETAKWKMFHNLSGVKVVDQWPLTLQGYPGREVIANYGRGKLVLRAYLVEGRLYMLAGGGRGYDTDNPDLLKFLDSFEFLEDPRRWTPPLAAENPADPPPRMRNEASLIRRLPARGPGKVYSAAFSPDGRFLAVGEGEHAGYHHLVVWEPKKNRVVDGFLNQPQIRSVEAVAFSADGKLLAAGASREGIQVLDWTDGSVHQILKGLNHVAQTITFSPDGKMLAAADAIWMMAWDVKSGAVLFNEGPGGRQRLDDAKDALVYRPDGKYLVTTGNGREICFRDPRTGAVLLRREYPHFSGVSVLAFSPDGKLLVAAGPEGHVMPYTGDGEAILTGEKNFPQMKGHSPLCTFPGTPIRCLAFRKDGLLAVGGENLLALVDPGNRRIIQQLPNPRRVSALSFSSDGLTLAAATLDSGTILYDVSLIDKLEKPAR